MPRRPHAGSLRRPFLPSGRRQQPTARHGSDPGTTVRTNSVRRAVSRHAQGGPAPPPAMTPGPAPQRRARRAGAARRLLSPKDAHAKAFLRIVCRGVWTGLRMAGLDGVSGLRPGLESPLLRHWRSGTGRRRKDEGEACRQALPRRCQTGACPGRQLRSLWDAVPEAGQRLADAADSRRGRKGCMPEQTATGAGFRQSASGAMATGTAQERGRLAGGTSSPLPASKAILVLGKQGQHASRLRDKAGFLPAPVQARSRAGPEPVQTRS